ncbi:MAG: hypothetical protein ACTSPV_13960 [Candidatus Hodarchaeales archaeon]
MRKVKFNGARRVGTLRPRRMWTPGEILEVEDGIAEELTGQPNFILVEEKKRRKKGEE